MFKIKKVKSSKLSLSSYQGFIDEKYETLVKIFGEPEKSINDKKTQVNWFLKIVDTDVNETTYLSIYDYKTGIPASENLAWNIGGYNTLAALLVIGIIGRYKKDK